MRSWLTDLTGRLGRIALKLCRETLGVTMLEYGLIAALVAAVCVGVITSLGTEISNVIENLASPIVGHH